MSTPNIKEVVKEKYGAGGPARASGQATPAVAAVRPLHGHRSNHVESLRRAEKGEVPEEAVRASLGCGNPTALAELQAGRDGARSGLGRRH